MIKRKNIFISLTILLFSFILANGYSKGKIKVLIKVFPNNHKLTINGKSIKTKRVKWNIKKLYLKPGKYTLNFKAKGYISKDIDINVKKTFMLEDKLEKSTEYLSYIKEFKTGVQPKCVEFTPDSKYFISALLDGPGADVFSVDTLKKVTTLTPPKVWSKKTGFVEVTFIERKNEIWVSQMTTGYIHIFDLNTFKYKTSFYSKGNWTKVFAKTSDEKTVYISHWLSEDITIINVDTRKVIGRIKTPGIPRGLAMSPDDKHLFVALFSKVGKTLKVNLKKKKIVKILKVRKGVKRHIVIDKKKQQMYVSDMRYGTIDVISLKTDKLIKEVKVGKKINTIALSPDNKYLFMSSRGPNNPESYYLKGPEFGKVYIMDTSKLNVIGWIWGKNQPTGLGVSSNGKYIAFSDFLDQNVELYKINYDKLKMN